MVSGAILNCGCGAGKAFHIVPFYLCRELGVLPTRAFAVTALILKPEDAAEEAEIVVQQAVQLSRNQETTGTVWYCRAVE